MDAVGGVSQSVRATVLEALLLGHIFHCICEGAKKFVGLKEQKHPSSCF